MLCWLFDEEKGFDRLILVIENIKKKFYIPIHLKIIGDGPEMPLLKNMIEDKGLSSEVELLGELNKDDIAQHMRQSDLFILLSRVETFGVVIIEALASGLYCIATKSGGPEYIISRDSLGELLENTDNIDYLSERIVNVFLSEKFKVDADLRKQYVSENYSYDSFLDSFEKLILSKYEISRDS
jgi:Glycosyltransferase